MWWSGRGDAGDSMPIALTDALCTHCGLCCDGTLFADIALVGVAEARRMEDLGLRLDEDSDEGVRGPTLMLLPCAGLKGTRCTVYAHRPRCCRTFECQLLLDARSGAVSVVDALQSIGTARGHVARVRALLARLGDKRSQLPLAERCAEALAGTARGSVRVRAQLAEAMRALERVLNARFRSR